MKLSEYLCEKYGKGLSREKRAELLCFCEKMSVISDEPKKIMEN